MSVNKIRDNRKSFGKYFCPVFKHLYKDAAVHNSPDLRNPTRTKRKVLLIAIFTMLFATRILGDAGITPPITEPADLLAKGNLYETGAIFHTGGPHFDFMPLTNERPEKIAVYLDVDTVELWDREEYADMLKKVAWVVWDENRGELARSENKEEFDLIVLRILRAGILNRALANRKAEFGGRKITDIILRPHAFEGVSRWKEKDDGSFGPVSDSYLQEPLFIEIKNSADKFLRGIWFDPTGGSLWFYNPDLLEKRDPERFCEGNPGWAKKGIAKGILEIVGHGAGHRFLRETSNDIPEKKDFQRLLRTLEKHTELSYDSILKASETEKIEAVQQYLDNPLMMNQKQIALVYLLNHSRMNDIKYASCEEVPQKNFSTTRSSLFSGLLDRTLTIKKLFPAYSNISLFILGARHLDRGAF